MNYQEAEGKESIPYQALSDENHSLRDEVQSLKGKWSLPSIVPITHTASW